MMIAFDRPSIASEIGGSGNFQHIPMPLMVVENTRVTHSGRQVRMTSPRLSPGIAKMTYRKGSGRP